MQLELLPNGVKKRMDGKGDGWANAHRCLGPTFNMQDFDTCFGSMIFGMNTAEKLFLEYVPDNYVNRPYYIRDFAVVAFFDRKRTRELAFSAKGIVTTAYYLWDCRTHSKLQPISPKFFFVIGNNIPPWIMVEVDINSGIPSGREEILISDAKDEWYKVWDAFGLIAIRNKLKKWVDP